MFLKSADTAIIEYIQLTTCLGDMFDILPMMVSFTINEDMFFPCLTGEILIEDSRNLFDMFSISGNETISIKFYSWDYSRDNDPMNYLHRTFDVLKVSDITQTNDSTKIYKLSFASPELKKNETMRISKSYAYSTISNVVTDLLTADYDSDSEEPSGLGFPAEDLTDKPDRSPFLKSDEIESQYQNVSKFNTSELFVEKTKYIEPYITLPYMKPFDAIKWLSNRAIRLSGGRYGDNNSGASSNFVFFENKRGYQFVSIDTLMENTSDINTKFVFGNSAQNVPLSEQRTVERENIEILQISDCYDVIQNIQSGMYSNKLLTYDIITGQLKENDYDYVEEFYNTESLARNNEKLDYPMMFLDKNNQNPLSRKFYSKYMLAHVTSQFGYDNITSDETQRNNTSKDKIDVEEYVQKRISQIARLNNLKMNVQIAGNSKHKVGDVVEVVLKHLPFKTSDMDKSQYAKLMKYYSGNYLITNIVHIVNRASYKMVIELTKDSYSEKIGEL
jgi:hypothetical protein